MNPKVSIIIPAYNHEKYIGSTIQSILSQTITDFEIVVIDDGSTDGTWNIICDFAKKDDRIIALQQNNSGVGVASQRGLELARGEWITFCGSDDTLPEKALEYLLKKSEYADVVIGEYETRNDSNETEYVHLPHTTKLHELFFKSGALWGKIYRKSFIFENNINFPTLQLEEDTVFLASLLVCRPRFCIVRKSSYCYWEHNRGNISLSKRVTTELFVDRVKGKLIALDYMKNAGCHLEYEHYYFMYIGQLIKQLLELFDEGTRERAYQYFKLFVLSYDWTNSESRFTLLTQMQYKVFEESSYKEFFLAQVSADNRDLVANMFSFGQIGFRYIFKYFKHWIEYKRKALMIYVKRDRAV